VKKSCKSTNSFDGGVNQKQIALQFGVQHLQSVESRLLLGGIVNLLAIPTTKGICLERMARRLGTKKIEAQYHVNMLVDAGIIKFTYPALAMARSVCSESRASAAKNKLV
jgi:hypothetical protein